jgi:anti-anti-sigma regulatory factor
MTSPQPARLQLPQELTIYTIAETRASWLDWLSSDAAQGEGEAVCAVDGKDVDEVDAAGVQLLVALSHSLQRQQRSLRLCHASRPLRQACQDLGVTSLLGSSDEEGAPA